MIFNATAPRWKWSSRQTLTRRNCFDWWDQVQTQGCTVCVVSLIISIETSTTTTRSSGRNALTRRVRTPALPFSATNTEYYKFCGGHNSDSLFKVINLGWSIFILHKFNRFSFFNERLTLRHVLFYIIFPLTLYVIIHSFVTPPPLVVSLDDVIIQKARFLWRQ